MSYDMLKIILLYGIFVILPSINFGEDWSFLQVPDIFVSLVFTLIWTLMAECLKVRFTLVNRFDGAVVRVQLETPICRFKSNSHLCLWDVFLC